MNKYLALALITFPLSFFAAEKFQRIDRDAILETIYRAEVHGQFDQGLNQLIGMLKNQIGDREQIILAMALIKHARSQSHPELDRNFSVNLDDLSHARAIGVKDEMGFLLPRHYEFWLELGDWLGARYVGGITFDRVTLITLAGVAEHVSIVDGPTTAVGRSFVWANSVEIIELLRFPSFSELNSFLPSNYRCEVRGSFMFNDWLDFIDQVCQQCGLGWAKRNDNIIVEVNASSSNANLKRAGIVNRTNQSLEGLLQQIADDLDMELFLDESIQGVEIDVFVQDKPWNEVIDCLAVMNRFQWWVLQEPGSKTKLIIHRE